MAKHRALFPVFASRMIYCSQVCEMWAVAMAMASPGQGSERKREEGRRPEILHRVHGAEELTKMS